MSPTYIPTAAALALVSDLVGGSPDTWAALLQSADEPLPPECVIRIRRRQKADPLVCVADLHRLAQHLQAIKDSHPTPAAGLLPDNQQGTP